MLSNSSNSGACEVANALISNWPSTSSKTPSLTSNRKAKSTSRLTQVTRAQPCSKLITKSNKKSISQPILEQNPTSFKNKSDNSFPADTPGGDHDNVSHHSCTDDTMKDYQFIFQTDTQLSIEVVVEIMESIVRVPIPFKISKWFANTFFGVVFHDLFWLLSYIHLQTKGKAMKKSLDVWISEFNDKRLNIEFDTEIHGYLLEKIESAVVAMLILIMTPPMVPP